MFVYWLHGSILPAVHWYQYSDVLWSNNHSGFGHLHRELYKRQPVDWYPPQYPSCFPERCRLCGCHFLYRQAWTKIYHAENNSSLNIFMRDRLFGLLLYNLLGRKSTGCREVPFAFRNGYFHHFLCYWLVYLPMDHQH